MRIYFSVSASSCLHCGIRVMTRLVPALAALLVAGRASAGPPFVTDDPEPVDLHHWEVYISSIYQHVTGGSSGTLPHIEINNGAAPNMQLHIIMPAAFSVASGGPMEYGIGNIELGMKYRFIQEAKTTPMVGIFPLLEVPTGDAGRGLGTGHLQTFLPVWIQKSWGAWTSYGGGGYWINPGAGNRNFWLVGWLLQKDLNKRWTLGGELFYTSPSVAGGRSQFNFNLGGQYNFDEGHHLLFSAGRSFSGDTDFMSYVGYQWTFGPREHPSPQSP
jgi:hypothetical protein